VPSEPNIPIPNFDFGTLAPVYADVVLSFTTATATTSCAGAGIPVCVQPVMPQTGICAGNPALGPPDMSFYTIPANGRIELGFLCSVITAQPLAPDGTQQPDFVIYGSFTGGAMPAVEVSMDGSNYVSVNPWQQASFMGQPAAVFQLAAANLTEGRFVRIGEAAGVGSINIDALEAVAGLVQ